MMKPLIFLLLCSTALLARSTLTVRVREAFSGAPLARQAKLGASCEVRVLTG